MDLEHGGGQLARALEAALAADAGVPRPPRDGAPPRFPNDLLPIDSAGFLGGHSAVRGIPLLLFISGRPHNSSAWSV